MNAPDIMTAGKLLRDAGDIRAAGQMLEALAKEGVELGQETVRRLAAAEALGRYVKPGNRMNLTRPAKPVSGSRVAAAVDVAEHPRSAASPAAEARTRELHRALAALDPAEHEWRLLAGEVGTDFTDRPDLLRRAWNPDETTLFAREVYRAVLDMARATHTARQEIWRRYNAAAQAAAAAKGERRAGTSSLLWVPGTATAQDVMTAPLQTIHTEPAFLAHLRFLIDYSTLSTRTLHAAMAKRVPRVPGHTTLVGWIKGARLPAQLSEPVLRSIVEALAENIVENAVGAVRQIVDEHVRTYRMLLARRQGEALFAGPVQRALGVLAEQELELDDADGENRIRREILHEVRERILAELEADRAHAMPASA